MKSLIVAAVIGVAAPAQAAVIVASATDIAPGGGAVHQVYEPTAFSASGSDLAEGLTATYDGNSTYESSTGVSTWTDGSIASIYPESGPGGDATDHATFGSVTNDSTATFDLGGLHDLGKVDVFAGWNDSGRDLFSFDLLVSADDVTYTTLATFLKGADNTGSITTPVTTQVSITDDAGALATGVQYVRLSIYDTDNGAAGLVEVDIHAAIPEPASLACAGLAALVGVGFTRRR